jgi:hypothetical protein
LIWKIVIIFSQLCYCQCCGSEFLFLVSYPQNFFSVSDSYTNILTRICLKWCLSLLSFVFWNLYDREKVFQRKNVP